MLKKTYNKGKCRVTFKLPADVNANEATLCGEFNEWDMDKHGMKVLKDGSFSVTVSLDEGHDYRFRYLLDGERWENDWAADAYVPNTFGTDDSLVSV
ncbi:MAG: 1,4-alpha-glucan branching enzyme [Myxococcota bacterium]|jgi:1,4-alpha-glucan branching enzyme